MQTQKTGFGKLDCEIYIEQNKLGQNPKRKEKRAKQEVEEITNQTENK